MTREQLQVHIARVSDQDLMRTVSTNGKVEPIEEFQAHAPMPGVIQQIYVQVGQKVSVGTLLLKMSDADAAARLAGARSILQSAQVGRGDILQGGNQEERLRLASDIESARLGVEQSRLNLTQMQGLQQKGAASSGEVLTAQQRLENSELILRTAQDRAAHRFGTGEVLRANAQVADATAAVHAAQTSYNGVNIHSPIAGSVYSLPVSQFDFVPSGDDLMDVADLTRIQVRAYFDEPEIGQLARGQAVKIVWDAKANQLWHGHIERAPTTVITYGTRSVGECLITVDDAKGDLLPNTNVTVTVTTSQRFNVMSIPREALRTEGTNNFVYRIVKNRLVRTPVQVGIVNLTRAEITGGLRDQDAVVLNATTNQDLTNGLEVKVVE